MSANREQIHNVVSKGLDTLSAARTGTVTSSSLDTNGFDACSFFLHYGATAPAPTSITVEESDDDSTFTTAPATSFIDDGAAHAVSTTRRIAYIGAKRYARVVVVLSASTILTICGMLGYPAKAATVNPA